MFLLLATLVSCTYRADAITVKERDAAKAHCINQYLNCYRLNRCGEKKYEYRIKYCNKQYTECVRFSKLMFDRISADDFIPPRFLGIDD